MQNVTEKQNSKSCHTSTKIVDSIIFLFQGFFFFLMQIVYPLVLLISDASLQNAYWAPRRERRVAATSKVGCFC